LVPATPAAGARHGQVSASTDGDDQPASAPRQAVTRLQPPDRWTRILHHQ
jgi:hypothetical protein